MNINDANKLTYNGIRAFARMERQGIRIDMKRAEKKYAKLAKLIDKLSIKFTETKFYKHWMGSIGGKKPNVNSNAQLSSFLYKVKKVKPIKLTKKFRKGSTDEEALEALRIPELDDLLRIRKLKKLRDTYLKGFMNEAVNGYIHPSFNLHLVTTYRSSSDSPNFQNIPVRDEEAKEMIRSCLFPRPGHQLLEFDYSGIEVSIAACYHNDPTMIKYIKNKYDMHQDMAKQIFQFGEEFDKKEETFKKLRYSAKNGFVFPQFYGDYFKNNAASISRITKLPMKGRYSDGDGLKLQGGMFLGEHLKSKGIKSVRSFEVHLKEIEYDFWNNRFPVYNDWRNRWYNKYRKNGYFDTLTGFRCTGVFDRNFVINAPVQGSAFHCLLWSLIKLDKIFRKKKLDSKLIGQVHDSIVFDVAPDELDYVLEITQKVTCKDLLKAWDWIIVPLQVEAELCKVNESWYHKEEIELI
ncbi:MAG TPA: hypothetical protein ENH85_09900 [Candidatus Scalindua sp.]|nr:hypothetical protein [Candidatus Scalindua sp.]